MSSGDTVAVADGGIVVMVGTDGFGKPVGVTVGLAGTPRVVPGVSGVSVTDVAPVSVAEGPASVCDAGEEGSAALGSAPPVAVSTAEPSDAVSEGPAPVSDSSEEGFVKLGPVPPVAVSITVASEPVAEGLSSVCEAGEEGSVKLASVPPVAVVAAGLSESVAIGSAPVDDAGEEGSGTVDSVPPVAVSVAGPSEPSSEPDAEDEGMGVDSVSPRASVAVESWLTVFVTVTVLSPSLLASDPLSVASPVLSGSVADSVGFSPLEGVSVMLGAGEVLLSAAVLPGSEAGSVGPSSLEEAISVVLCAGEVLLSAAELASVADGEPSVTPWLDSLEVSPRPSVGIAAPPSELVTSSAGVSVAVFDTQRSPSPSDPQGAMVEKMGEGISSGSLEMRS